jgi:hypothetical protein
MRKTLYSEQQVVTNTDCEIVFETEEIDISSIERCLYIY